MSAVVIRESGVDFGTFASDDVFEIEKSLTEKKFGDSVKKVEFIVRMQNASNSIALVEAKSSIPRDSKEFFEEIKLIMVHSLTIWFTSVCGRHSNLATILPSNLNDANNLALPIKLILVIPTVPDNMLSGFSDAFRKALQVERALWGIGYSDIFVLNESKARNCGLIDRAGLAV